MLPIRCFGCKKLLGHLWETWYIMTERKCIFDCYTKYRKDGSSKIVQYDVEKRIQEVFEEYGIQDVLSRPVACDYLGLTRVCCRNVMMSTVEYD